MCQDLIIYRRRYLLKQQYALTYWIAWLSKLTVKTSCVALIVCPIVSNLEILLMLTLLRLLTVQHLCKFVCLWGLGLHIISPYKYRNVRIQSEIWAFVWLDITMLLLAVSRIVSDPSWVFLLVVFSGSLTDERRHFGWWGHASGWVRHSLSARCDKEDVDDDETVARIMLCCQAVHRDCSSWSKGRIITGREYPPTVWAAGEVGAGTGAD